MLQTLEGKYVQYSRLATAVAGLDLAKLHYRCGVCGWILLDNHWLFHWARRHSSFLIPFSISLEEPSIFKQLIGYDFVNLGSELWNMLGLKYVNYDVVKKITPKLVLNVHNYCQNIKKNEAVDTSMKVIKFSDNLLKYIWLSTQMPLIDRNELKQIMTGSC